MKPDKLAAQLDTALRALVVDARVALLTDLDGTLVPFARTAADAGLGAATAQILNRLTDSDVQVVVVSGRPKPLVDALRPLVRNAWWVAEHGGWIWDGQGWVCRATPVEDLAALIGRLTEIVATVEGAYVENKTASVCLHWRNVADTHRASLLDAAELAIDEWLESHLDHDQMAGVDMVEVGPRARNKGAAVDWVRDRLEGARIVALGDDLTDERMFAKLGEGDVAISVGTERASHAGWAVDGVDGAHRFLGWLADARAGRAVVAAPARTRTSPQRRRELLVISNRMPIPALEGRRREVGGLVAALEPALQDRDATWLGWSGQDRDRPTDVLVDDDATPARAMFDLTPRQRELFYAGFCNQSLWPWLHGFPNRIRFEDEEWSAYRDANQRYADAAVGLVAADGMIWVHDYHLLLTATALRERGHHGPIGLFLHVPFPPLDVVEMLPWAKQLLDGMLAFDLIAFHTSRWACNFTTAAQAISGRPGGTDALDRGYGFTRTRVLPLGIDPEPFRHDRPVAASAEIEGLRANIRDRKLLLGVDRLDYSKGIPERLEGFERLLEKHPRWRGKVCFVQVSVPSRADVPEYVELRRRVEHLVGRINGRFGEADWTPVRYLYRSYGHGVLAQLYRAADVAVVTPLCDGMNLVAKEFVAAQDPASPGVLVLSRFAGAAEELEAAILTNPYHRDGLADDLDRALSMPRDERIARHVPLRDAVLATTARGWANDFLGELATTRLPKVRHRTWW